MKGIHLSIGLSATSEWEGTDGISVVIRNEEFGEIRVLSCTATWRVHDSETEHPLESKKVRTVRINPYSDSYDDFIFPKRLEPSCIMQCGFQLTGDQIRHAGIDTSKYPIAKEKLRADFIVFRGIVVLESQSGMRSTKQIIYHHLTDSKTGGKTVEGAIQLRKNLALKILEEYEIQQQQLIETIRNVAREVFEEERSSALPATSKKIFVVHGHDEDMLRSVSRYLKKLGLLPIILRDLPNQGRTIIEKFTHYSDVSFAVVLLSPDDMAYPIPEDKKKLRPVSSKAQHKPRARQNVILELGFFVGSLGRHGVVAIHKKCEPELEIPSDYSGVIYTPYDETEKWKPDLKRELTAAKLLKIVKSKSSKKRRKTPKK